MKRLNLVLTTILLLAVIGLNAQPITQSSDIKEIYKREHIVDRAPAPYPFIREANVMWEKTIWRMVNLREKMNLPLYYPLKAVNRWISIPELLTKAVISGELTAYNPDLPYEFEQPMTPEDVVTKMEVDVIVEPRIDQDGNPVLDASGNIVMDTTGMDYKTHLITRLLVKEKWIFDKEHSVMRPMIVGICPIKVFPQLDADGNPTGDINRQLLYWVYYPEARNLLSNYEVYNRNNDAQRISYDDLFMQRRFNGYIYKASNVYNNRAIVEYMTGLDAQYEAERIKQEIFEYEHDLWEY